MTYLITGACGFIGSNLALRLLSEGHRVIGVDRPTARHAHSRMELQRFPRWTLYDIDLTDTRSTLDAITEDVDIVFHLAANADVRFSSVYPHKDLNDGIIATYNLLRWAKQRNISKIAYSSTSAIYGDPTIIPTPETYNPTQTSFYGAAKVAGEALIQAHCHSYGATAWVFRFASITGPRYSHGFIYNFYMSLKKQPHELYVHGGKDQRKTYLDVDDCIDAMLRIVATTTAPVNTFNIGNVETCRLTESIPLITEYLRVSPTITWSGNDVGWIGDSKVNYLDVSKLQQLGWTPKYTIAQSIIRTLDWLEQNPWILDVREEL